MTHGYAGTLESGLDDTSLEERKWETKVTAGARSPLVVESDWKDATTGAPKNAYVQPLDGKQFAWFGSYRQMVQQELFLKGVRIPLTATHLSFFVFAMLALDSRSALHVVVDDRTIAYIDGARSLCFSGQYRNFDVSIKDFADGGLHTILFRYYGTVPAAGDVAPFFLVDVIRLLRDSTRLLFASHSGFSLFFTNAQTPTPTQTVGTENWHPDNAWPARDECTVGCERAHATDDQCDPACNNVMCGFDNGRCEGVRPHVVGSTDVCYSGEAPMRTESTVCAAYAGRSCCARPAEAEYMAALLSNTTASKTCRMQPECARLLEEMLCATCAPQSNTYFRAGKLRVCRAQGEKIYDMCASSQMLSPVTGACATVDSLYSTASAFIGVFGDPSFDACYGANTGGGGLGTGAVVAIVVVCIVVVVAVAAVAVFFVLRRGKGGKGGKDGQVAMGEIPDASSNMTLVPVDMMSANPDGGVIFLDGAQAQALTSVSAVSAPAPAPGSGAPVTSSGNVSSGGVVSGVPAGAGAGAGATMMMSQNMPMMMMTPNTMDGMDMNTMVVPMPMTVNAMGTPTGTMQAVPAMPMNGVAPMPMMAMPMMDMNGMVVMNTTANMSQLAQQVQPPADPSQQTPTTQQ